MTKINYTDATSDINQALDSAIIVDDFLPPPGELVKKNKKEKITIAIDKQSLDMYKKYAKKHNAKYQSMINEVVGAYANKYLK